MSLYPDKNVNVRKFVINSNFNIVYRSFWEKDFNTIQVNNAIVYHWILSHKNSITPCLLLEK